MEGNEVEEDEDEEEGHEALEVEVEVEVEVDAPPTAHRSPNPALSSPLKSITSSLIVKSIAVLPELDLTPLRDANSVRSKGRSGPR